MATPHGPAAYAPPVSGHHDVYDLAPKVELHLHMEGAIPHATLWDIVCRNGGDPAVPSIDVMVERRRYRDFLHFIDEWTWMTGFLRTPEDFTELATAVAAGLVSQRIVYAEASVSPSDYRRHGITPQEVVVATRRGLDAVPDANVGLIVDVVREPGPVVGMQTLDAVLEVADEAGVVGITIGGAEDGHPPGPFTGVYRKARSAGLGLSAHAGEGYGPESVRQAIDELAVDRIGHGVRSVEDPSLVTRLVDERIPLEVCPTSNLRTGVAPSWDQHQVGTLIAAGAVVTISTDDPAYFHCDLAGELRQVATRFGDGPTSVRDLTIAAVGASWLDPTGRSVLAASVGGWWDRWDATGVDPGPVVFDPGS